MVQALREANRCHGLAFARGCRRGGRYQNQLAAGWKGRVRQKIQVQFGAVAANRLVIGFRQIQTLCYGLNGAHNLLLGETEECKTMQAERQAENSGFESKTKAHRQECLCHKSKSMDGGLRDLIPTLPKKARKGWATRRKGTFSLWFNSREFRL